MHRHARHIVLGVQMVLVVLVALFVAMGINSMVAAQLAAATPNDGVSKLAEAQKQKAALASATEKRANNQPQFNNLLYNRNLFNQDSGESEGPATEETDVDEAAVDEEPVVEMPAAAPGAPVPSDMMVLLVGTQVNEDPAYSLAIMKDLDASDGLQDVYKRTGGTIREDATIVQVDRERVYFSRASKGGAIEFIELGTTEDDLRKRAAEAKKVEREEPVRRGGATKERSPNTGSTPAPDNTSKPAPRVANAGAVDPNAIERLEDGSYGVPRDMAESIRQNPNVLKDPKFGRPPQIQPVYSGGGVNGFRVLGVQSGSIYSTLGIKNGDIIMNVNGRVVDNPQKALAFFDQLGPNQDVTVKVNRRGKHTDLKYSLK